MPPFLEIGDTILIYLEILETPEEKLKFEQLYFLYRDKMYAVAFKILHNENDAEDIVHESFKAIIENFEKINDISCHKTWNYIVTIVRKFYTCNTTMHFPVRKSLNLSIKHLPTFAKSPSGQRQC